MNNKIFIACDTTNISKIKKIINNTQSSKIKVGYKFEQDLEGLIALTKVNGTSAHPDGDNYPFNRMEDFSHIRFELKYFF